MADLKDRKQGLWVYVLGAMLFSANNYALYIPCIIVVFSCSFCLQIHYEKDTIISSFFIQSIKSCFPYRQRRGFPQLLENLKLSPKIRIRSTKNTRTEIKRRTKSIRSTNIGTKIEVKTKTRRRRRIKVGIKILVVNIQKNTMKRFLQIYHC